MNTFLVLYLTPTSVLDDWINTPEEERKAMEEKVQSDWAAWMEKHGSSVKETRGASKTKLVTADGVADTRNDVMMFSLVEAESPEAAAKMFEGHPHLSIPESSIEIMTANSLPGM
ncbi:MAG TPA: hypothetical protein VFY28_01335 [Candidatus Paceibacterota bacterium]|nr:hypothetical protein [Candidatus Paceibacterota bacterium]